MVFCPKKQNQVITPETSPFPFPAGSNFMEHCHMSTFFGNSVQSRLSKPTTMHGFSKVNLGMSLCEPVCHNLILSQLHSYIKDYVGVEP